MRIADLAGLRVAIWGYGREGRAAIAALRRRLPALPLTVLCRADEAAQVRADLAAAPAQPQAEPTRILTAAPDAATLSAFDVVIKSPGISAWLPDLLDARRNGTRFTSGTALWFAEHPEARVVAVTGTKGKSTTTALIAHLLRRSGRRVALAGNIGLPLLDLLDPAEPPDWWVIELSSFQTGEAGEVAVGLVTNLYEEHLDWHGDRARYVADKLRLADAARVLVVNGLQPELQRLTAAHPAVRCFGTPEGWHVAAGGIACGSRTLAASGVLALPGRHNALNACAALATIEAAGEDAVAAAAHLGSFRPLPHRLQPLGERAGLHFVDDSIATTPQATLEALHSLADPGRATVIVGGHDRGLDWQPFAAAMHRQPPQAIVVNGASAARVGALLRETGGGYRLRIVTTLAEAVAAAREETPAGGTVLLSPGAPSFDQFRDYAERGRAFAALAGFDPDTIGSIEGLGIA
ncbi:UDP-N-acetylmuramoyl-L-alanine--D-glutamate ligase [Dokdonella koreensis]|nr:UDP-N-acetylmuramoyl-L-alanine--D-glutamate ligase [Dokdonella koreensis]